MVELAAAAVILAAQTTAKDLVRANVARWLQEVGLPQDTIPIAGLNTDRTFALAAKAVTHTYHAGRGERSLQLAPNARQSDVSILQDLLSVPQDGLSAPRKIAQVKVVLPRHGAPYRLELKVGLKQAPVHEEAARAWLGKVDQEMQQLRERVPATLLHKTVRSQMLAFGVPAPTRGGLYLVYGHGVDHLNRVARFLTLADPRDVMIVMRMRSDAHNVQVMCEAVDEYVVSRLTRFEVSVDYFDTARTRRPVVNLWRDLARLRAQLQRHEELLEQMLPASRAALAAVEEKLVRLEPAPRLPSVTA